MTIQEILFFSRDKLILFFFEECSIIRRCLFRQRLNQFRYFLCNTLAACCTLRCIPANNGAVLTLCPGGNPKTTTPVFLPLTPIIMKHFFSAFSCLHRLNVLLSLALCSIIFTASVIPSPIARAEGFALYEWSARGIALAGSTMARRPDPSAVAYNPAQITRLPGVHLMGGMSFVTPHGKITTYESTRPKTSTVNTRTWYIPHAYYTHQINDRWTFGLGGFSRYGLGFKYDRGWPGQYNARSVSLETFSLNPVMAFKATDKLSLAGGIEFIYCNLDISKGVGQVADMSGDAINIESQVRGADGVAVGANLAAHYQFDDHWAAGISYRSQATVTARGENEFKMIKGQNLPHAEHIKAGFPSSGARGTVTLPDSVAFGLAWMPTEKFSLEAGATWTRWSTFRTLRIHLGDPMNTVSESKKQWKDSWRVNIGAEYDVTDWLALRLGYLYDQSPMTSSWADYLVPTHGRHIYSTGVGIKHDNWTFDAAYGYVDIDGRRYSHKNGAANGYHGVLDSKTHGGMSHIISFSLGYQF